MHYFISVFKVVYTAVSYSPCGRYICAGTMTGDTTIWDLQNDCQIKGSKKDPDNQCITSIQWHPIEGTGELAYMDNAGQFGYLYDIFDNEKSTSEYDGEAQSEINKDDIDFGDCMPNTLQYSNKYVTFKMYYFVHLQWFLRMIALMQKM